MNIDACVDVVAGVDFAVVVDVAAGVDFTAVVDVAAVVDLAVVVVVVDVFAGVDVDVVLGRPQLAANGIATSNDSRQIVPKIKCNLLWFTSNLLTWIHLKKVSMPKYTNFTATDDI
ncbi:MAG: hypothetical protein HYX87_00490 [Chloroflexi bacterium]|nr:hypothetical protein [Chloroflexota bacterium]